MSKRKFPEIFLFDVHWPAAFFTDNAGKVNSIFSPITSEASIISISKRFLFSSTSTQTPGVTAKVLNTFLPSS